MLYYSHINEDSRVERELLKDVGFTRVVAVAGSGERIIALMDNASVKIIDAIDVNIEALHLLQLKIIMLLNSNAEDYMKFIGHHNAEKDSRKLCFEKIKTQLTIECRQYWEQHLHIIESGILNAGHFEIFLKKVRPLLSFMLGKSFLKKCSRKGGQQEKFLAARWKIVSWFFSQQWVYRLMGNKDIAFISTDASVKQIPVAVTTLINEGRATSSFITHLIFNGHLRDMVEGDLPPSLQERNLNSIRERLIDGQIVVNYHHADILEHVRNVSHVSGETIFYSVSDILSFEDQSYLEKLINNCLHNPGNRIIIRSFIRNRLSPKQMEQFSAAYGDVENFQAKESTGMYQVVAIKS